MRPRMLSSSQTGGRAPPSRAQEFAGERTERAEHIARRGRRDGGRQQERGLRLARGLTEPDRDDVEKGADRVEGGLTARRDEDDHGGAGHERREQHLSKEDGGMEDDEEEPLDSAVNRWAAGENEHLHAPLHRGTKLAGRAVTCPQVAGQVRVAFVHVRHERVARQHGLSQAGQAHTLVNGERHAPRPCAA